MAWSFTYSDITKKNARFLGPLTLILVAGSRRSNVSSDTANQSDMQSAPFAADVQDVIARLSIYELPSSPLNEEINSLLEMAQVAYKRYELESQMKDLEEAISHYNGALALLPEGDLLLSGVHNNLGAAMQSRFSQLGQIGGLEGSISHFHNALSLRPPGHPDRSTSLNNIAAAVQTRFDQLGQIEDLQEAISHFRGALELFLPGHPDHSACRSNLGVAVGTRFLQLGQIDDLEE